MNILKGPTDEESYEAFQLLKGEEIFKNITEKSRSFKGDRWFELAAGKGFTDGMPQEEILLKAAQGGSQKSVTSAHEKLRENKTTNIKMLLKDAFCEAAKYDHLNVLEYLINFVDKGDVNLILLYSYKDDKCVDFAFENGADLNYIIYFNDTENSVMYHLLSMLNPSISINGKRLNQLK